MRVVRIYSSLRWRFLAPRAVRQKGLSYRAISSSSPGDDSVHVLPSQARVVICGGGVAGCSVAYHLSKNHGWKDVLLLEQGSLACGTTWHAAGLIGRIRATNVEAETCRISSELYSKLEEETGVFTGYKRNGAVNLAKTRDRMISLKQTLAKARSIDLDCEIIGRQEIEKLHPLVRTDDVEGALWVPGDGTAEPANVTQALAKGATLNGAQIFEKIEVEKVLTENNRVCGVETNKGKIDCQYFINCGGMWARNIGLNSTPRVRVPLHATEHFYLVTKPIEGVRSNMPTLRDYDGSIYVREWGGGVLAGGFEQVAKPLYSDGIPKPFEFMELEEDWDHFQPLLRAMLERIPLMETAEVRKLFNGPESFTPDARFILGESPEVDNYYVATGFNSGGIASGGGAGSLLADWIVNNKPPMDMWHVDIQRFSTHHNNINFLRDRVKEVVGIHYALKYPMHEFKTARKMKCSPLHGRMEAAGAVFGEKNCYERPNWFNKEYMNVEDFVDKSEQMVSGFGKPRWFDAVKAEYLNCRLNVSLIDMTSFSKYEVQSEGDEATSLLQYLCPNDIDVPASNVIHTPMLDEEGCYVSDCSVARIKNNHYFIIAPTELGTRQFQWMKERLPSDGSVRLDDVTNNYTGLNVLGPKSRELLSQLTQTSMDTINFKPFSCKEINLAYASGVQTLSLTHAGELGCTLYIPNQYALTVHDALMEAGDIYGIQHAGAYALKNLRIQKSIAYFAEDFGSTNTPFEIGRDNRVKFDKGMDFIGREALLRQKEEGVKRRLITLPLDGHNPHRDIWPWGGEPIYRNGQLVGMTTSSGYCYSNDKMICLGWVQSLDQDGAELTVTSEYIVGGHYEVDILGQRFKAKPYLYSMKI